MGFLLTPSVWELPAASLGCFVKPELISKHPRAHSTIRAIENQLERSPGTGAGQRCPLMVKRRGREVPGQPPAACRSPIPGTLTKAPMRSRARAVGFTIPALLLCLDGFGGGWQEIWWMNPPCVGAWHSSWKQENQCLGPFLFQLALVGEGRCSEMCRMH